MTKTRIEGKSVWVEEFWELSELHEARFEFLFELGFKSLIHAHPPIIGKLLGV